MNEIYIEENAKEIIVSVEYLVGGREAESAYHFQGEMKEKFRKNVLIEGMNLEESCVKRFDDNLNEWKLKDFCKEYQIQYEKTFWVC